MRFGDISIKKQLMAICIVLVTIPVIILGLMSYNSAKQGILNNIKQTLKTQVSDWLITTQAYYDLVQENKRSAQDRTKNIVTSQALGILDLIHNNLQEDATAAIALKEPLLRARKYEKDMLLYGFTTEEFDSYVRKFDLAIIDIEKIIAEANSAGLDTESQESALEEYKRKMQKVKLRERIEAVGDLVHGEVRQAFDKLESEFDNLADKVSDKRLEERLKEVLASTVIGQSGYVYMLDYKGNYILSKGRKRDGENVWYAQDNDGRFFVQDVIGKGKALKEGDIDYDTYTWKDTKEEAARNKLVAVIHIPAKEWVVGVTFYPEDLLEADFEEVKKEELKSLMAEQRLGKTGFLYIIGAQEENKGRCILSKDRKTDGENILWVKDAKDKLFIKEIVEDAVKLKEGESKIIHYLWKDTDRLFPRLKELAYVYFKPWDWTIGASVYLDEFFTDINNIRNQIILVCVMAIILGSTVASFFASMMTDTFRQLVNKMNSVARGNLDVETGDVKVLNDKNEIGQLATAFKRMSDNLRETLFSKDYVDNIVGNMNDALLVIDKERRIKTANKASCQLLGYDESEILKRPLSDFFMQGQQELKDIETRILQGEIISDLEMEFKDKQGNSIPVSFNGAPFKDAEGEITSAILAARDIREYKRLVDELSSAQRNLEEKVGKLQKSDKAMLFMVEDLNAISRDLKMARDKLEEKIVEVERSNKELDDFTYVVSHDLKEPLRGITFFSNFLNDKYKDKLDEQGRHYIDVIQHSVEKMQTLIKDLLELSRISRRKKTPESVDLNQLLAEIKEDLALRLKESKAELKISPLPTIKYEKIRITQLFTNLITNAIKYNDKEKPIIEVGCDDSSDKKEFKCYVKDNGKGIPREFREKIFGLFQRLDADEQEGTGAGLTICKKIVESHRGSIWLESTAGQGSTFYFTIPKEQ